MPPHELRNPENLLPPMGFSHIAIPADGQVVHIAGQTAHQPDGTIAGGTIAAQMSAALRNLVRALDAAGAAPEHLVAMQIYVTDVGAYRDSLSDIGPAWRQLLGGHYPAISLLGVTELFDPDAMVEIVSTAVIPT